MPGLPLPLLEKVAAVACELSLGQSNALALEIEEMDVPKLLRQVAGLRAPTPVTELSQLWLATPTVSSTALADALRAAAMAVKTTSTYEKVEALVTGPHRGEMRRSEQGLLEVIRGARVRLWIVSFVLRGEMAQVVSALADRTEAEVDVRVLVDHRSDSALKAYARLAADVPKCRIFVWPEAGRRYFGNDRYANLHAKCAIADGRQAFVSSANLTDWAMGDNLEVGYLVTGGATPASLDSYFEELLATGELSLRPLT